MVHFLLALMMPMCKSFSRLSSFGKPPLVLVSFQIHQERLVIFRCHDTPRVADLMHDAPLVLFTVLLDLPLRRLPGSAQSACCIHTSDLEAQVAVIRKSCCRFLQCRIKLSLCASSIGRSFMALSQRVRALSIASSRCGFIARQGISALSAQD